MKTCFSKEKYSFMGRILEPSSHWAKNECVCFHITCRARAQKWTICSDMDAYIAEERWALTMQTSTELLSFLGISLIDGSYSHKRTWRITWPGHLGICGKKKIMRELEQEALQAEQRIRRKSVYAVPNMGLLLWPDQYRDLIRTEKAFILMRRKYFNLGYIECSNRRTKWQLY